MVNICCNYPVSQDRYNKHRTSTANKVHGDPLMAVGESPRAIYAGDIIVTIFGLNKKLLKVSQEACMSKQWFQLDHAACRRIMMTHALASKSEGAFPLRYRHVHLVQSLSHAGCVHCCTWTAAPGNLYPLGCTF